MAYDAEGHRITTYRGQTGYWQDDEESGEPFFVPAKATTYTAPGGSPSTAMQIVQQLQSQGVDLNSATADQIMAARTAISAPPISATSGGQTMPTFGGLSIYDFQDYNRRAAAGTNYSDWPTDAAIQYQQYLNGEWGDDATALKRLGRTSPISGTEQQQTINAANLAADAQAQFQASQDDDEGMLGLGQVGDIAALAALGYFAGPALGGTFGSGSGVAADVLAAEGGMFGLPTAASAGGISGGTLAAAAAPTLAEVGGYGISQLAGGTTGALGTDTVGTAIAPDVLAAPGGMFGLPEVAGAAAPGISGGTLASAIAPAAAAAVPAPAAQTFGTPLSQVYGGATAGGTAAAASVPSLPTLAAGASLAGTAAALGGGGGSSDPFSPIGSQMLPNDSIQGSIDNISGINQYGTGVNDLANIGSSTVGPLVGPQLTGNDFLDRYLTNTGVNLGNSALPNAPGLGSVTPDPALGVTGASMGTGTTGGVLSTSTGGSFWDELAKVVGGQTSTATGLGGLKDLLGGVVGGFNAQGIADTYANTMKDAMAKYSDTMKYAVDQSDPFRDQRAQYQTQLADLVAGRTTSANNPNMMDTSQNNPNYMSLSQQNNPYIMNMDQNNPNMMSTSRANNPWLMDNNPVNNPAFMDTSVNNPYMMNTNVAGNPNLMDMGPNNPYMKNTNLQNNPDLMSMSANNPYAMSMDRNNPWTMSTSTENNPWLADTQLDMNNPLMRNLSDATIDNTLQRLTSKYGGDVSSLGVKDILTKQLNAVNAPLAMDYYKSGLTNNQQYLSTASGNNMNYLNAASGNNQKYLATAADYNQNYLNTNTRANSDYLNTASGFNTNYLNTASANNQKYLGTAAGFNSNYLNTASQNNTNYLNTATNNNQRYLGTAATNNQQYASTAANNNQNLMRTAYGNNLDYMKTVGTAAGMNIQPNTGQVAAMGATGLSNLMSNYANQNTQLQNQAYGNYGVAANSALDMLFKAYNNYNTTNTSGGVSG